MVNNLLKSLIVFVILAVLAFSSVSAYSSEDTLNDGDALGLQVTEVKINGDAIENGDTYKTVFDRGDSLEIKVELIANGETDNVEVEAFLSGDDHQKITETSDLFDMGANERKIVTLDIGLPDNMEQDQYSLRVMVSDRLGQIKVYNYNVQLKTARHGIEIRDVVFSPYYEVKAGNGLFATIRIKNTGLKDEEGIKVTVSIPELKLSDSVYIDEVEAEDQVTTEELWPGRIPACTAAGDYDVDVRVEFNEGDDVVTTTKTITVVEGDFCGTPSLTVTDESINVPTTTQDVTAGVSGAVYAVIINNPTAFDKTYTVTVTGVDGWGVSRVDPANVFTVGAGKSKAVSVYVAADKDATEGAKPFVVKVESDTSSAETYLTANVEGQEKSTGLKSGLQIALIVLIVLLFILGLIIGFSKMRGGSSDEDVEEAETYY